MKPDSHSNASRVLITGMDGFTGNHLAKKLKALGFQVFGTTHSASSISRPELIAMDLCSRADLARVITEVRPDYVVHLAAISFVAHGDMEAIYRVNIVGTRNLLEALTASPHKPKQVLLASSANIYGNADVEVIDETIPPSPANDYAVSKIAMEHLANLWTDRLPIVIVRPFNYTGIGQAEQFLIPKIVSHFQRKETVIELGNIEVERDFSDVRRITEAYTKILCSGLQHGVFNVCSGQAHSLKQIIQLMENIAGYKIEVQVNPAFVRANEVKRLLGSCDKLIAAIGDIPNIAMYDTLRWMYTGREAE